MANFGAIINLKIMLWKAAARRWGPHSTYISMNRGLTWVASLLLP